MRNSFFGCPRVLLPLSPRLRLSPRWLLPQRTQTRFAHHKGEYRVGGEEKGARSKEKGVGSRGKEKKERSKEKGVGSKSGGQRLVVFASRHKRRRIFRTYSLLLPPYSFLSLLPPPCSFSSRTGRSAFVFRRAAWTLSCPAPAGFRERRTAPFRVRAKRQPP